MMCGGTQGAPTFPWILGGSATTRRPEAAKKSMWEDGQCNGAFTTLRQWGKCGEEVDRAPVGAHRPVADTRAGTAASAVRRFPGGYDARRRILVVGVLFFCGVERGNCAAVRSRSPLPVLARNAETAFQGSHLARQDAQSPRKPGPSALDVHLRGEDIMKSERDSGLLNACPCCKIEEEIDRIAASQCGARANARPLRGGAGDSAAGPECGRIEMIVGPMFAGKSTELMRRIRRHKLAYKRCLVIKYARDQRHGEKETELSTHDNNRISAVPCNNLYDAITEARDSDVIGIDEAQFYPDLIKVCVCVCTCVLCLCPCLCLCLCLCYIDIVLILCISTVL